jgi:uncharacterized damage-inducible protein DinB
METIARELLVGFDEEMAATKKTLERVPLGKLDWKPHERSMAIGRLAAHVATLPRLALSALKEDSMDMASDFKMPEFKTNEELVAAFEDFSRKVRAAIEHAKDDHLNQEWTLMAGDKKVFSRSRAYVVRLFTMNHMIHHRAQLGVYLRLNEIPVPAIYGPSADEKVM